MAAAVELEEARKSYGKVEALRGVSFQIQPREVVAMLGPNGAGKTTSISLMLGLRKPTGGRVRLFGLELPWLLLGVLAYPVVLCVAWVYVRQADRNERDFVAMVEAE